MLTLLVPREAMPFGMFQGALGHRGEDCTVKTLQKIFRIRDKQAAVIGQITHDTARPDEKFGRQAGFGVERILDGWARQGIPDRELWEHGMQSIEALYRSVVVK